jgi:hypothetical protein
MINASAAIKPHNHTKSASCFEYKNQDNGEMMKKINVNKFILIILTAMSAIGGLTLALQLQKVESNEDKKLLVNQEAKSNEQMPNIQQFAPPNDRYADARIIDGDSGKTGINTVQATKESNEPNHASNTGGHSVWYRWRSTVSDCALTIKTSGSNFDTTLAVYEYRTNGNTGELLPIAANNDAFPGISSSSHIIIKVEPDKDYYIAVDGHNDGFGEIASGTGSLNWHIDYYTPKDGFSDAN